MIFKAIGDARPYPDHGLVTPRDWSEVSPRMVRLDELVTTKRTLDLAALLSEDSTFYGDLFAHVVQWEGTLYLEDGLHRALRAALHQRPALHARVLRHQLTCPSSTGPPGRHHIVVNRCLAQPRRRAIIDAIGTRAAGGDT